MLSTPDNFLPLITHQDHPDRATLLFLRDELLLREDLGLPEYKVCEAMLPEGEEPHVVGILGERYMQTGWAPDDSIAPPGHVFRKLRSLFGAVDEAAIAVACRAYQIAEWARTHRYCGACATPTERAPGERCMKCPNCGHTAYPRISPAMMVLIRKEKSILLARNVAAPAGRFSALAGFLEAGESIEEAVHREVFEEVGLKVHQLRYFGSQPWSFPHSLMIAYVAEYLSGDIRVDPSEIAEAHWYGPDDELPGYAPKISIAGALIKSQLIEIGHFSVRG